MKGFLRGSKDGGKGSGETGTPKGAGAMAEQMAEQGPVVAAAVDPRGGWEIRGEGNSVDVAEGVDVAGLKVRITGNNNLVRIERGVQLANAAVTIMGDRHVVRVGARVELRNTTLWFEDSDCVLEIGEATTSEGAGIALTEPGSSVVIGKDCMFSYGIDVRTGDSHSILDASTGERLNYAENVVIGDHVWVGARATILKGVTIARDSIVATGAVVTRGDGRPGVILAGNPARVVKEGVTWHRARLAKGEKA